MNRPPLPGDVHIVNCLELDDPRSRELCRHLGTNPGISSLIIAHHLFKPKLLDIARHLKSNSRACVYFGCRKGKHRSVAMLAITRFLVKSELGVDADTEFACSDTWNQFQRGCITGRCRECTKSPGNIAEAIRIWRSA